MDKVRIDKWLWAARFFKTRSLAKAAIEGGKVHIDGNKSKASRQLELGTILSIRQGFDVKVVEVIGLSEQRRGAPEALLLYNETAESVTLREQNAAQRKAVNSSPASDGKPNKKQRRQIHRFLSN
ncbi:S4 domain-containing protein [Porticoccaceae bacterium]|jgi:ribosome-associated heat shock protein Hsp15|nr:S4 domain-containing protein [Porticoccaceae bacterium]